MHIKINHQTLCTRQVVKLLNHKQVNSTAPCTSNAGLSKFRFTAGKIHRLRLINAGTEGLQRFSIDNHEMTVIANDFVSIQPYSTKVVTLSPGQRSDVLVTANAGSSDAKFWMRSNISTICCNTNQPNALAGKSILRRK